MKAYILSEDESHGIALANIINTANHTAIMSEVASDSYSELIDEAVEGVDEGYDLTVLISKKPLEACIEANRTSKLRAVVCKTQSDAMKARRAKANVMIIDAGDFNKTTASSIMRGWFSAVSEPVESEPETSEQKSGISSIGRSALGILNSGAVIIKGRGRQNARAEQETSVEEEETEDLKKPKGKGVIKNIKYMFGIE